MAALAGRNLRIKYDTGSGFVTVAGAKSDTITFNKGMIDITDKDDQGVRTLLDDFGVKSISMKMSGVLKDTTLIDIVTGSNPDNLPTFQMELVNFGTWEGAFFVTDMEIAGEEGDTPVTFSASFESSGAVVWTAA